MNRTPIALLLSSAAAGLLAIPTPAQNDDLLVVPQKATRLEANTVAFRADMVESSPPKTMVATPKDGMKLSAARTIAVSPFSPRNCQVS